MLKKRRRLQKVMFSKPIHPNNVKEALNKDMKSLVNSFAKRLKKQEGLRDDIIVIANRI